MHLNLSSLIWIWTSIPTYDLLPASGTVPVLEGCVAKTHVYIPYKNAIVFPTMLESRVAR